MAGFYFEQLNIAKQAKEWGIPLWQHPQFLFLMMGCIIAITDISAYFIGQKVIADFPVVLLLISSTTGLLFIITFIIERAFEQMAEANRMKTEFVSIVSHQLRTPITNLSWALDYLKTNDNALPDGQLGEYLKILKVNSERMKEIINNLLIVSRLESNKVALTKESADLCLVMEDAVKKCQGAADVKKIKIEADCGDETLEIFTDPFYLGIILENFLNNAIRYSKEGSTVNVHVEKNDGTIIVSFNDDGIGIPQKDQKLIFQKFFRASNVRQTVPEGSGLGLFISQAIAKRLSCRMGFQSKEGSGSTFWITIPIK